MGWIREEAPEHLYRERYTRSPGVFLAGDRQPLSIRCRGWPTLPSTQEAEIKAATTHVRLGARARWRPDEAAIEARSIPAYAAEGIGTFLLVFFICAVLSVGNAGALQLDLAGLGILHALALGVLVYALAASSGAHFNPAVTVAQLAIRQIRGRDAAAYIVFQLAGGMLAGLLVLLLFHDAGASVNYGATAIDAKVIPDGSPWLGLIAEALGTFMLMWAVMAVAVNPRGEKHFAGLVIGGALGLAVMVFGPATGAGLNPARWLGPALASGSYSDFWIYIVGPIAGALLAALGYRTLVLSRQPTPTPRKVPNEPEAPDHHERLRHPGRQR